MKSLVIVKSEVVDISSTDHAFTLRTVAIRCAAAGTVVARLRGDSAARTWAVSAGEYLLGDFLSVTRSGTSLTAANAMIGVSQHEYGAL